MSRLDLARAGPAHRAPLAGVARDNDGTVFDVVAGGFVEVGRLLAEFHHLSRAVADDPGQLRLMEDLQHEIAPCDGWSVALAQAPVSEPYLLRLEKQLIEFRGGVLFVTHDRALLTRLATRIVELDRAVLTSWAGDYPTYPVEKAAALEEEARRARNEGRVRARSRVRARRARAHAPERRGEARVRPSAGGRNGRPEARLSPAPPIARGARSLDSRGVADRHSRTRARVRYNAHHGVV